MDQDLLNTLTLKNIDLQEELDNSNQKINRLNEEMLQMKAQYERSFQSLLQENESLQEEMNVVQIDKVSESNQEVIPVQDLNIKVGNSESHAVLEFTCKLLVFLLGKKIFIRQDFLNAISSNLVAAKSQEESASCLVELLKSIGLYLHQEPYLNRLICTAQLNAVSQDFSCPNIRKHLKESVHSLSQGLYQELCLAAGKTASLIALDQKYSKLAIENNNGNKSSNAPEEEQIFDRILQHLPHVSPPSNDACKIESLTKMLQESEEKGQIYHSKMQKLLQRTKELEQTTPMLSNFSPTSTNSPQTKFTFTSDILLVDKYEKAITLLKKNSILSYQDHLSKEQKSKFSRPNYSAIAKLCNEAIFRLNSK